MDRRRLALVENPSGWLLAVIVLLAGCMGGWIVSYYFVGAISATWGYSVEAGWSWGIVYVVLTGEGNLPPRATAGMSPISSFGPVVGMVESAGL